MIKFFLRRTFGSLHQCHWSILVELNLFYFQKYDYDYLDLLIFLNLHFHHFHALSNFCLIQGLLKITVQQAFWEPVSDISQPHLFLQTSSSFCWHLHVQPNQLVTVLNHLHLLPTSNFTSAWAQCLLNESFHRVADQTWRIFQTSLRLTLSEFSLMLNGENQ